jgi:hypothetical protein
MRAFSYVIAVVLVLTGPSLADPENHDLPGIGTFAYCGTPIVAPAPKMVAALGQ